MLWPLHHPKQGPPTPIWIIDPLLLPPYLTTSSPGPTLTGRDNSSRETTPVRMEKNNSDDTVVVSTQPKTPPTTVNNTQHQNSQNPSDSEADPIPSTSADTDQRVIFKNLLKFPEAEGPAPHYLLSMRYWLGVKCGLPKEIAEMTEDLVNNVNTYSRLYSLVSSVTSHFVGWKEDYPNDCETMVNKVFYAWWGRSTLSIGKKILYIQATFVAEGKPTLFDMIILKYPDLKMLLEYARSDVVPAIPSGNGAASPNVRPSYDNSTLPSHGYVETGKVSAEEYDVIHLLSAVIWNEPDYVNICDSLGVPLEYGPHCKPKYSTWML